MFRRFAPSGSLAKVRSQAETGCASTLRLMSELLEMQTFPVLELGGRSALVRALSRAVLADSLIVLGRMVARGPLPWAAGRSCLVFRWRVDGESGSNWTFAHGRSPFEFIGLSRGAAAAEILRPRRIYVISSGNAPLLLGDYTNHQRSVALDPSICQFAATSSEWPMRLLSAWM